MVLNQIFKHFGFQIAKVKKKAVDQFYDLSAEEKKILELANQYSMTGNDKIAQLIQALNYLEKHKIKGDIVECGVWRGGSMLAAALTLIRNKSEERSLFLFDTFEGMNAPTEYDKNIIGINAINKFEQLKINENSSNYCYADIDDVKKTMALSNYPAEKVHFIKGMVEETLPHDKLNGIALLRLDTDWYESTRHELIHLYDKVVQGGIIIFDDYGYWEGHRKAIDEYLLDNKIQLFLARTNAGGRIAVKY